MSNKELSLREEIEKIFDNTDNWKKVGEFDKVKRADEWRKEIVDQLLELTRKLLEEQLSEVEKIIGEPEGTGDKFTFPNEFGDNLKRTMNLGRDALRAEILLKLSQLKPKGDTK